jgi:SAM-dependent methyltransferase
VHGSVNLARLFELHHIYSFYYKAYLERGINLALDPNDFQNRLVDEDEKAHYFEVGADAIRLVLNELLRGRRTIPRTILDFPCGAGRVTRHLRAFFPQSRIVACDLYDHHVKFCVRELGVEGMGSKENFDELDFGLQFDLIFCGSLLTHLPEEHYRPVIRLLSRSLTAQGIAIVTLLGRHSEYAQKHKWKYLDDSLFAIAEATVAQTGFGFVDYDYAIRSKFDQQAHYGITLSRPHWILRIAEEDYGIRLLNFIERGWDDHQDVLVIGKPPINDPDMFS